jgi:hypothetical protein
LQEAGAVLKNTDEGEQRERQYPPLNTQNDDYIRSTKGEGDHGYSGPPLAMPVLF